MNCTVGTARGTAALTGIYALPVARVCALDHARRLLRGSTHVVSGIRSSKLHHNEAVRASWPPEEEQEEVNMPRARKWRNAESLRVMRSIERTADELLESSKREAEQRKLNSDAPTPLWDLGQEEYNRRRDGTG